MRLLLKTIMALCVSFTTADCMWDAAPDSDFITSAVGEAVARAGIEQVRDIWPPNSLDNDIIFEASRLLQPDTSATAAPSPAKNPTGAAVSGAQ